MNSITLVALLAVAATVSAGYGQQEPQISVRVQEPSYSPPQRQPSYQAPPPPQRQPSYQAPPPQRQPSYEAPPPQSQEPSYSSSASSSYNEPARQQIPILRFNQEIRGGESDSVEFETGNGIKSAFNTKVIRGRPSEYVDENGQIVQTDSTLEQNGHSSHQSPDGQNIALTWSADSEGFHPSGDHLPKPVEMPADHAEAHREALAHASSSSSYGGSSYEAPAPQRMTYAAPAPAPAPVPAPAPMRQQSYEAPNFRVNAY